MAMIVFIFGLAMGSFLNAYIFRLYESTTAKDSPSGAKRTVLGRSVWRGRSYCPKCKKPLRWYELIPLISFVVQWRKCRGCRQKIDWQYPTVELVTGILFLLAYYTIELSNYPIIKLSQLATIWYLLSILIVLFVYDLRYGLVPDRVVLPAIAIAFIYRTFFNSRELENDLLPTTYYLLLATTVGATFFWLQYALSRGRWLGAGDIRIGALMGAMLGWPHIFSGIVISYIIGGAVSVGLLAAGRKKFGETLPLGTFLTLGAAIIFLYGEQIWKWYWR